MDFLQIGAYAVFALAHWLSRWTLAGWAIVLNIGWLGWSNAMHVLWLAMRRGRETNVASVWQRAKHAWVRAAYGIQAVLQVRLGKDELDLLLRVRE